jgi:hypothetical protein
MALRGEYDNAQDELVVRSNSRDSHNDHNHGLYSAIDAVETFWSLAPLGAFASTNSSMASVKPSSGLEE